MAISKALLPDPVRYDITFTFSNGGWVGRCDKLGLVVSDSTLDLTREQLTAHARHHLRQLEVHPPSDPHVESICAEQLHVQRILRQVHVGVAASREAKRGPYVTDGEEVLVRNSVVTVLDELGTTERWKSGITNEDVVARRKLIDATLHWLGGPVAANIEHVASYTDNYIHAMPVDGGDPLDVFSIAIAGPTRYQLELACRGTLLRGGVAVGDHHGSANLLMGSAMLCAHHIESREARFPRIVLSDALSEAALRALRGASTSADVRLIDDLLVFDRGDQKVFVNYLGLLQAFDQPATDTIEALKRHRDALQQGLALHGTEEKHAPKWRWAADYHNYFATTVDSGSALSVSGTADYDPGAHTFARVGDEQAHNA